LKAMSLSIPITGRKGIPVIFDTDLVAGQNYDGITTALSDCPVCQIMRIVAAGYKTSSYNTHSACQKARLAHSELLIPLISAIFDDISLAQNPVLRRRFPLLGYASSCYSRSTNNGLILTYTSQVNTQELKMFKY
jgi:hypothetical protein